MSQFFFSSLIPGKEETSRGLRTASDFRGSFREQIEPRRPAPDSGRFSQDMPGLKKSKPNYEYIYIYINIYLKTMVITLRMIMHDTIRTQNTEGCLEVKLLTESCSRSSQEMSARRDVKRD